MNVLKSALFVVLLSSSLGIFNAVADTLPSANNAQSESAHGGAHYGVFEYTNTNSLINAIKLLDKYGFHSNVVAETLDLNAYQESVDQFFIAHGTSLPLK